MAERIMDPNNIRADHLERYNFAVKKIKELVPKPNDILDIGCGIGYGSYILHNMLNCGVDCIDKSPIAHGVFLESFSKKAPRMMSIILFLNDDYEGGGLRFRKNQSDEGWLAKPKANRKEEEDEQESE